jgi:hypothetical protein
MTTIRVPPSASLVCRFCWPFLLQLGCSAAAVVAACGGVLPVLNTVELCEVNVLPEHVPLRLSTMCVRVCVCVFASQRLPSQLEPTQWGAAPRDCKLERANVSVGGVLSPSHSPSWCLLSAPCSPSPLLSPVLSRFSTSCELLSSVSARRAHGTVLVLSAPTATSRRSETRSPVRCLVTCWRRRRCGECHGGCGWPSARVDVWV